MMSALVGCKRWCALWLAARLLANRLDASYRRSPAHGQTGPDPL